MRVITVKMPEELVEALDEYCIRHGLSRSEAIRAAVTMLLIKQYQKTEEKHYNEEIVVIE